MSKPDRQVRWFAAQALGEIGAPSAVEALTKALNDQNSIVRRNAAEALGKIGDPSVTDSLIKSLHDPYSRVRYKAAEALGRLGSVTALPELQLLEQNDAEVTPQGEIVKDAAAKAIAQITSKATK